MNLWKVTFRRLPRFSLASVDAGPVKVGEWIVEADTVEEIWAVFAPTDRITIEVQPVVVTPTATAVGMARNFGLIA